MLRERGVPVSSVKLSKTEANKPYIKAVRPFFPKKQALVVQVAWAGVSSFRETDQNFTISFTSYRPCLRSFSPDAPLSNDRSWHGVRAINEIDDPVVAAQPITDLPDHEQVRIGYNVTHDGGLIAMGFEVGTTSDEPWMEPPAHRIGVDVMHLSIPDRFTLQAFVETVGDAVRTLSCLSRSVFSVVPRCCSVPALLFFPEHVTIGL